MLPKIFGFLANIIFPTIQKESDAQKIVAKFLKKGVHYMKLACDKIPPGSPEMPPNFLTALVKESHKNNLKVFVHIGSVDNALSAINAGADILAHGIWRDKLTKDQAEKKILVLKKDLFNIRFKKINNQISNPAQYNQIKKSIARLYTNIKNSK